MTIDVPLKATLKVVGELMTTADDAWWIIGSAAVALHGADPGRVGDVDVLLSIRDAERILPSIGLPLLREAANDVFDSSIFGTWKAAPLPVEFMAGFRFLSGTRWLPVEPMTREPMDVNGVNVFVPSRAELHGILSSFGRPKDIVRAACLAGLDG